MKKVVVVLLAIAMLIGLCACSKESSVENALKSGSWTREFSAMGVAMTEVFTFKDNGKVTVVSIIGTSESTNDSTYTIEDGVITVVDSNGDARNIYYTYENDTLEMKMRSDSGNEWQLIHTP